VTDLDDKDFDKIADSAAETGREVQASGESAGDALKAILGSGSETGNERTAAPVSAPENVDAAGTEAKDVDAAGTDADNGPSPSESIVAAWKRRIFQSRDGSYGNTEGYAPASSRSRTSGAVVRNVLLTVLCIVIGIVAALQYKTIASRKSAEPDSEARINELLSTINNLHSELNSLEAERNELKSRLEILESSTQDEQLAALREELNSIRTFAGLTTVKGHGVHVRVDFSERTNVNLVQTRLLLLINELRASGAQAISINGVRILAMTEVRVVNEQYISVSARQLAPPYDIYAIGDATDLYNGLKMGGYGIVDQINELAGASCELYVQEEITISAAEDSDIRTDLLKPAQ
jgi:uncharacterized protein YlxW (UPF0749 family)